MLHESQIHDHLIASLIQNEKVNGTIGEHKRDARHYLIGLERVGGYITKSDDLLIVPPCHPSIMP